MQCRLVSSSSKWICRWAMKPNLSGGIKSAFLSHLAAVCDVASNVQSITHHGIQAAQLPRVSARAHRWIRTHLALVTDRAARSAACSMVCSRP